MAYKSFIVLCFVVFFGVRFLSLAILFGPNDERSPSELRPVVFKTSRFCGRSYNQTHFNALTDFSVSFSQVAYVLIRYNKGLKTVQSKILHIVVIVVLFPTNHYRVVKN